MGMNDAWGNFEIETEKVIDNDPNVWIKAADDDYNCKKYNQAMEKTRQAKEFANGQKDIVFSADMIDFRCMMDMGDYNRALQKLSNQSHDRITKYFAGNSRVIIRYLHLNLPKNINDKINEYWQSVIEKWLNKDDYMYIAQHLDDIDPFWFSSKISNRHIYSIIKDNHVGILGFLTKGGYNFDNYRDDARCNVVQKAVERDSIDALIYFLKLHCFDVNYCNKYGDDALLFALRNRSTRCVKELLAYGANAKKIYNTDTNSSALQMAIHYSCDTIIIANLLNNGADVNYVDDAGKDALYYSVMNDSFSSNRVVEVTLLLQHGAQINSDRNKSLFCQACKKETITSDMLSTLLKNGADVFFCDEKGHDGFYYACLNYEGNSLLENICAKGVNIDKQYDEGETILNIISQRKHWNTNAKATWRWLIKKNANVNIKNNKGYTPLMNSVDHNWTFSDELEMARALVSAGADTNIKANDGETVMTIMRKHNIDPHKLYDNSSSNFFTKLFS